MNLREAIRTIVQEVAGEEIRRIVREVLLEELMAGESPRTVAAKKAAATRRANLASRSAPTASPTKIPHLARKHGVSVGQKYKGKHWDPKTKDRVIEVARLEDKGIVPKILQSSSKRTAAKRISYARLMHSYDRVE
jgi:hypothetical protein